jgi:7,8-dihydropterin-6-yl-methyl-4-(beta-D-ribofuranosyl)aminobenzene 5'-phosphate synthase
MVKVTCVVDNTVQQGSRFWGEHGLSFWIETGHGSALFDTGGSESVFMHNLKLLQKQVSGAGALIVSHAHYDHTGSLEAICRQARLPLYASPDMFRPRFALLAGKYVPIGLSLTEERLSQLADLRLGRDPVEVIAGVWTSGEIGEREELEGGSPRLFVPDGDGWRPDRYQDDMSLVLETQAGLVLVCGCCHSGLLNTLAHVHQVFQRPVTTIAGGSHLISASAAQVQHVISVLRDRYDSPRLYLNHCTGEQAFVALAIAFGDLVHGCPAGATLTFD